MLSLLDPEQSSGINQHGICSGNVQLPIECRRRQNMCTCMLLCDQQFSRPQWMQKLLHGLGNGPEAMVIAKAVAELSNVS